MSKQIQDAYIVAATRLPVGRRKGLLGHVRPDDMLAHAIRSVMAQAPGLDPALVEDVIVGCAMPEAEQGMNVARIGLLLAGLPNTVPGVTVNRFCASGLQTVAMAADRIRLGEADVMIAGGTETMSLMNQIMGNKVAINPAIFEAEENYAIGFGMGITAEKVAAQWKISRDDQDAFAVASNQKACAAIAAGHFKTEISPYLVSARVPNLQSGEVMVKEFLAENDEGPRSDSSIESLARLRPAFAARGSVTAGNSSQMSDGAGAVLVVSERILRQFDLKPLARFAAYAVAGVPPEVMGIGPVEAIPRVLRQAGISQDDVDWFELNEAFAAQALAVIRTLHLDPGKVNPLGGAIALGHPLGATGTIRTATLLHGMQRTGQRYGMVSMCIGTGMGAAGLFEAIR
ncbi:MAG TPA: acetyl-CoA C-acyltransferase [Accumulibacter sp.]|uniref:acetyl-CoA C-acyltransferase n=2 Tax=Candidatus Accumulibacter TaxID=327159 RepID=A0A7D5SRB4_9PROT|nr:acetyl-CoA C-acyltransferase [Accumulibacter sp.]MCC2868518.1 acetyl-CoA C-acyltransferase [Candidatus Accumulibacter phosphatis]QLH50963.1 MAG: acetyl-CoA C-acyltransferase [Candidatus Accumulibacter cognatus]MCM8580529.1 acetyl-CoA C-acyltransferase [Accumulibacter sp.]MCQ1549289.1 acetyl-CoA C-acyltransferase [Candidatus Accumulibacter phosphatis]HMW54323.1 acetyl-CoA C-acyltransferase [Accumulibacter sp.]